VKEIDGKRAFFVVGICCILISIMWLRFIPKLIGNFLINIINVVPYILLIFGLVVLIISWCIGKL